MEIIEINLIRAPKWTIKNLDEVILTKLYNNVRRYGQLRSVAVREVDPDPFDSPDYPTIYEAIEGRHIVAACRRAGMEYVVAKNFGKLSDLASQEVNLQLNDLDFRTDFVELGQMFKGIIEKFGANHAANLSMYDAQQCKKFVDLLEFDWESFDRKKIAAQYSLQFGED